MTFRFRQPIFSQCIWPKSVLCIAYVIPLKYFFSRLVHAITPLEENKSFLEKVKLGEKLCGISSSESLLSTSSWSSTAAPGTEEVAAKKSAENLQNRTCKGTEEISGLVYSSGKVGIEKNAVFRFEIFAICLLKLAQACSE